MTRHTAIILVTLSGCASELQPGDIVTLHEAIGFATHEQVSHARRTQADTPGQFTSAITDAIWSGKALKIKDGQAAELISYQPPPAGRHAVATWKIRTAETVVFIDEAAISK